MRLPSLFRRRTATPVRPHRDHFQGIQAITFPVTGAGYSGVGDPLGVLGILGARLPGSDRDWAREIGDPALNATMHGCIRWVTDNVNEPELQVTRRQAMEQTPGVKRREQYEFAPLPDHPLTALIANPNDEYDGDDLLGVTARDFGIYGNAYWVKERDNVGRVIRLWWVPWWMMTPRWPVDGAQFITDYLYRPGGVGKGIPYAREDVVHFRWTLDGQTAGRLGVHRTKPVLAAIAATNEGNVYTATLLINMGVIPHVIFARGPLNANDRQGIADWFRNKFTRDGRGGPGIIETGDGQGTIGDIKELGGSPEKLKLDTILDRPDIQICNAWGIHPGVLYLGGAGGKGFDNGGQLAEARRASYHDCLLPMTKKFAKTLTRCLLPEFEKAPASQVRVEWDFSGVQALQEDQDALHARVQGSYNAGLLTLNEAREMLRLPSVEDDQPVGASVPMQEPDQDEGPDGQPQ